MLELLFSALICVVEYSIFIMFLQHYLNDRWERSRKLFCFKFLGLLICSVTLTFINTFQNSLWNVLTVFTLTFILSCIFYQGKWLVKIFLAVVTCTLSLISEFITMVMGSAIFGENLTVIVTLPSVQVPMTIISKVLLFTLVRIIFLIKRGKKYTRIGKESLLLYTLPVVTVANIILMVQLEYYAPSEESHKVLMAFVCIGLILCNIAVFFIYDKNLKKYELENQLRQAQEMQRLQASYYMQLEKSLNESRKQMHDFKNHITTLEHLHQGKENTKAVSYMQELQQQMKEQMNLASFKVKNAAFDVILYEQNKRCQELGITFEKQVLYDDLRSIKRVMYEIIMQSFLCCFDFLIVLMLFHHFLLDRWEKSILGIIIKAISVLVCGVSLACINFFGVFWLNVIVAVILNLSMALSFYKGKLLVKFFLSVLVATLSIFFEFFVIILTSWIFGENLTMVIQIPTAKLAMTIISKVLLFIVIRIIFIFTKDRKYAKSGKEVLFLFTLPIVTIANIILMVKLESYVPQKESHKILMSLVCFGLILCNIAVFFIYDRNLRKYELENQLREAEEMQRIQASYYKQIEKGLNESRKQLHDFKNHITTLERLYHTDSKDKALNYMHELQAQMSQQMAAASFRVNNTAFDVILYEQEKACKEQGITFEKQILYNDLSILKYIDTCTIFANALDNAVKACSEIQNGEKKITLEVKRTNDILSIIIENTKQNHVVCENEKFVSSKADKHNHGFGVENIKMAVEKYNGIVSIDYTDTIFTLAISIPLLNEQK